MWSRFIWPIIKEAQTEAEIQTAFEPCTVTTLGQGDPMMSYRFGDHSDRHWQRLIAKCSAKN
jgi:hypothetical protein